MMEVCHDNDNLWPEVRGSVDLYVMLRVRLTPTEKEVDCGRPDNQSISSKQEAFDSLIL
jgi:hypothetical protein